MDNDDRLIGRVLSRRDAMRLLAASGVATAGAWGATLNGAPQMPACVVQLRRVGPGPGAAGRGR